MIAGAELFTGNNLIVIAWADKKVTTGLLLRNWLIVYIANFIGATASAIFVELAGIFNHLDVSSTVVKIAQAKVELEPLQMLIRGILCNALVCLAVWLCFSARHVSGKILAIIFPVSAFVALGFEHSIANMYFIPLAMLQTESLISLNQFFTNLVWVTAGNIIGGSVLVALVYWACYVRK